MRRGHDEYPDAAADSGGHYGLAEVKVTPAPAAAELGVSPEGGVMRLRLSIALALMAIGGTVRPTPPASPQPDKATGFDPPEVILEGSERLYPAFADIDGDGKIDML